MNLVGCKKNKNIRIYNEIMVIDDLISLFELLVFILKAISGKIFSKIKDLFSFFLLKISSLIVSKDLDIKIVGNFKDSNEYFKEIWKEDFDSMDDSNSRLKLSLIIFHDALLMNFEMYFLRKTLIGRFMGFFVSKLKGSKKDCLSKKSSKLY